MSLRKWFELTIKETPAEKGRRIAKEHIANIRADYEASLEKEN